MQIALKIKLALACAAGFAGLIELVPVVLEISAQDAGLRERQAIVEVPSGSASYRVNGEFTSASRQASAPLVQVSMSKPLAIMKHQVSSSDYQLCVDDGGCRALDRSVVVAHDRPAVQTSWYDAIAYAAWLSRKTGETYRLPTDEEWAFAAGSKFNDDGIVIDQNDPSKGWIAVYVREADRAPSDPGTRSFGSFGTNENGLQDIGGNVWEWTTSCFVRTVLDDFGKAVSNNSNCGVRIVEGQHRAYLTDFIRDAKAGGCAVGLPPENLGFRLVVDRQTWLGVPRLVRRAASQIKALL